MIRYPTGGPADFADHDRPAKRHVGPALWRALD
jgi:hypothetical protein